ncbi:hypothetical protein ACOMHN_016128 [Nucella lapillus]
MVNEEQIASVSRINKLEAELERQQRYSRRSNVLLYGMEEDPAESCSAKGNDYAPSIASSHTQKLQQPAPEDVPTVQQNTQKGMSSSLKSTIQRTRSLKHPGSPTPSV